MRSLKFLLFIFILFPLQAQADFVVTNWNEAVRLVDDGKNSVITIAGQVKNLPKDQAMTAFSISFDSKEEISIANVSFEGKPAKYDFAENVLKITFPQPKISGQRVSFSFLAKEKRIAINPNFRQEAIYVPNFAVGAEALITVDFPGYELISYNPKAVNNGNVITYSAVVPKEGINEIIKFTQLSATWNVAVKTTVSSEKPLGEFMLKMPLYFQASRHKVEGYMKEFSTRPVVTDRKGDDTSYTFKVPTNKLEIKSSAKISTGPAQRRQVMRNMINYSKVSQEEATLLTSILQKIRGDSAYAGLPIYVAIGKFVNKFLTYDLAYVGKLPSLEVIVTNRLGVCTEYARLYDGLARLAGIPSFIIDGAACDEKEKCQGHSWNMIFYGGRWIEVDPTWNLMSGAVSSSHVYINDEGRGEVEIKYRSDAGKVNIEMGMDMIKAE